MTVKSMTIAHNVHHGRGIDKARLEEDGEPGPIDLDFAAIRLYPDYGIF
jgi:hypothetical protein